MRPIDANKLKEVFKVEELYGGKRIIDLIDNAPTVEPEKPQGEWIKNEPIFCGTIMQWRECVVECQCPECKKWCLKWANTSDYEKCPHCGADMRTVEVTDYDKGGTEK